MGGPGSGRPRYPSRKECGADREAGSPEPFCVEHRRDFQRLAQRRHRGWPAERMGEPSGCRPPRQWGRRLYCIEPLKDSDRASHTVRAHSKCYTLHHRLYMRRMLGWSEEECSLPPLPPWGRPRYRLKHCRTCGGPRYDGGTVYWTTRDCRACWLKFVNGYKRDWRVRTGRTLSPRRRTDGAMHA